MASITVNLDNLSESERAQIMSIAEKASASKDLRFPGVKDGETFKIGDIEFIKFPDMGGVTPVVTKDSVFKSEFGSNNNLAESRVLKRLENEFLPKITAAIGEENICTIETDLTTLDGLNPYGKMTSRVSLPTFDFYRANVAIFDRHKIDKWWWLATPDSAQPHYDPVWVVCVSPSGRIDNDYSHNDYGGVRPFLLFVSSIFESSEE